MTELRRQCLVRENIKGKEPPGEALASEQQTKGDVDQQLGKVVRTGHELEPASHWHPVGQSLHCSWRTRDKQQQEASGACIVHN